MKIINRLFIALFAVFAATSCSDDFFDVNTSENNPSSSTPQLSLPVAQKYTVDLLSGDYNSYNTLGNLWSYAWAAGGDYVYFTDETQYLMASSFRQGNFNTAYLRPLNNYQVIINNTDPVNANYKAIAMIMKAFHFQYLVDQYGDVPYTEALQRGNNVTPAYDDDQFIYNDLIVQLTAAQDMITASASDATVIVPGTEDVMCGGDMAKWAKFANSLKLRILLRQSEIGVTDYSSVNNGIGFLGAGETVYCNPGYTNDTNKQNPLYANFGKTVAGDPAANANATRATPWALTQFGPNDTRLRRVYSVVGNGNPVTGPVAGIDQNSAAGTPSANLSGIGPGVLLSSSQDAIIMQSAESLLLQSEAVLRGFIPGDAEALYNAAVQESFTQLGAGSAATYLANEGAYPGTVSGIISQKWIALNGTNGLENWIEYKRTGFPLGLPNAPGAAAPGTIPVRLLYPATEAATNPDNVPVQTTGDAFASKVFWDN
ncbi:MAG TPA: SusD/RagB family nutrient-binding outer membrane lipoprotein [Flavobacterium sp.]|nr:SusD/RagB family nutrient-binding outer membrane lipoprotein [Flavobacterium sp.]